MATDYGMINLVRTGNAMAGSATVTTTGANSCGIRWRAPRGMTVKVTGVNVYHTSGAAEDFHIEVYPAWVGNEEVSVADRVYVLSEYTVAASAYTNIDLSKIKDLIISDGQMFGLATSGFTAADKVCILMLTLQIVDEEKVVTPNVH